MSKDQKKSSDAVNKYYSRISIYKATRATLATLVTVAVIIVGLMINKGMISGLSWLTIGLPICLSLTAFVLFPVTEEWEYTAWQAKPQRYEQHFKN